MRVSPKIIILFLHSS